jgi:hypothetical protein
MVIGPVLMAAGVGLGAWYVLKKRDEDKKDSAAPSMGSEADQAGSGAAAGTKVAPPPPNLQETAGALRPGETTVVGGTTVSRGENSTLIEPGFEFTDDRDPEDTYSDSTGGAISVDDFADRLRDSLAGLW